ncbi:MAG: hypothetical protein WCJ19_03530, partial [bacterium]
MKNKICIITSYLPFPPDSGGRVCMYYKIIELSKYYDIYLVSLDNELIFEKLKITEEYLNIKKHIKEFLLLQPQRLNTKSIFYKINALYNWIFSITPYHITKLNSVKNTNLIKKFLSDNQIKNIIIESTQTASLVNINKLKKVGYKILTVMFDIDHKLYWDQNCYRSKLYKKLLYSIQRYK